MTRELPTVHVTVLAIVADRDTRELLPKALVSETLHITDDLAEGLALAQTVTPDVAFIELAIGDGAGLAMVHHLKTLAPNVTVFALVGRTQMEQGAHAVALGGAGLFMLPLGGDEALSAIATAKARLLDRAARRDLEETTALHLRAAGWMARVAELAVLSDRAAAGKQLIDILMEATGASGAAIYLSHGEPANELGRIATSSELDASPPFGMEDAILEYARKEGLLVVPLALRTMKVGQALIGGARGPESAHPPPSTKLDGLVRLIASQATAAFALLTERDRSGGSAMKDPSSSAYSFAYYVDVAGREIDKARRYGRRFAIVTVAIDPDAREDTMTPAEIADRLLQAARDTDVLARVDENEFHLLMPESDGLAAHACRRRIFGKLGAERGKAIVPRGVLVGVATFPHDGSDLSQLLRVARRRADGTKCSVAHKLTLDSGNLAELLEVLEWDSDGAPDGEISAPRTIELDIAEASALASAVVGDAIRGGSAFLAVAHHDRLGIGAAVRAALGAPRDGVTFHAIDVTDSGSDIEALSVLAEHGAYALIGRNQQGVVRGIHAADPLLADVIAERLGRAAGLRVLAG